MRNRGLIRSTSIISFIPIIFAIIIYPAIIIYIYISEGNDLNLARQSLANISQIICPVVVLAWPFDLSQEILCGRGNELLYLQKRIKIHAYLIPIVLYLIILIPSGILINMLYDYKNFPLECARIAIQVFLIMGLYYMMSYASNNFMVGNIVVLAYVYISASNCGVKQYYSYICNSLMTKKLFFDRYYLYIVAGLLLFVIGIYKNRNMTYYN